MCPVAERHLRGATQLLELDQVTHGNDAERRRAGAGRQPALVQRSRLVFSIARLSIARRRLLIPALVQRGPLQKSAGELREVGHTAA